MKYCAAVVLSSIASLAVAAQESAPIALHFDRPVLPQSLLAPVLPRPIAPGLGHSVSSLSLPKPELEQWGNGATRLAALTYVPDNNINSFPANRPFRFVMDPYGGDYSSGGVIASVGRGYLYGSSSFTARPALGNVGSATVSLTHPLGDNVSLTAGVSGNKYHFGREAWNSFGVWGQASWRLNETLTLNAFGQYYNNQRFHAVAAMPFVQDTRYGGTLNVKMSERFSLDVGAQRYYDVYQRRWRTVPIVAPTLTVMGQPISIDAGGLIYQILDNLFGSRNSHGPYENYAPGQGKYSVPPPAGFNANSPVRIPDALRR